MTLLLNLAAIATLLLVYSLLITLVQNTLAVVVVGWVRTQPTRSVAVVTSFASSFCACLGAISLHESVLRYLGSHLTIWPILIWGVFHVLGAARSFGVNRVTLIQADKLTLTGGDLDAPRFVFFGQFYGLLFGLFGGMIAHFFYW